MRESLEWTVNGPWVSTAPDAPQVNEPGSGKAIYKLRLAQIADVTAAAERSFVAQPKWFSTPYESRAQVLRKAADLMEAHSDLYTGWLVREAGSVPAKAGFEVSIVVKALREAAAMPSQPCGLVLPSEPERLSICRRMPLGVVGVISPFNFPMYLAMRAVAPALAVGNSVILKPDPRTTVCGGLLLERLFVAAGLPADVLSVLPGDGAAGEALCINRHVAMIQFTGSTTVGKKIGSLAGGHLKKLSLELGGKNSLIILDDADPALAAANASWAAYLHQGQICMSSGRILVQAGIFDKVTELLTQKAQALPMGDPTMGQMAIGPMISKGQVSHAISIVQDSVAQGAKLRTGGTADGLFFKPAVLTNVTPKMRAFTEEIFGPVAVLIPFATDDEAIELANDTEYGLSAAIISSSVGRAMRLGARLRTGLLHINDQTVGDEVVNPFGGRGQSGNGTSIGGPANWDEFSQWQWVTVRASPPPYPF